MQRVHWSYPGPCARHSHSVVLVENKYLYLFFGCAGPTVYLDDVHLYDTRLRKWLPLTVSGVRPAARAGHSCAYCPRRRCVYVYGGRGLDGDLSDMHVFDLDTHTWSHVPHQPWSERGVDGKARRVARQRRRRRRRDEHDDGDDEEEDDDDEHDDDEEDEVQWMTTGLAPPATSYHSSCVLGDELYVFGGSACFEVEDEEDGGRRVPARGSLLGREVHSRHGRLLRRHGKVPLHPQLPPPQELRKMLVAKPQKKSSNPLSQVTSPTLRAISSPLSIIGSAVMAVRHAGESLSGSLSSSAGSSLGSAESTPKDAPAAQPVAGRSPRGSATARGMFKLDLNTMEWSAVEHYGEMPIVYGHAAAVLDERHLVVFSEEESSSSAFLYRYDAAERTWDIVVEEHGDHRQRPSPRQGYGMDVITHPQFGQANDAGPKLIFVVGGVNRAGVPLGDMWAFDMSSCVWQLVDQSSVSDLDRLHPPPYPRSFHTIALSWPRLLLFGGVDEDNSDQTLFSDVHIFHLQRLEEFSGDVDTAASSRRESPKWARHSRNQSPIVFRSSGPNRAPRRASPFLLAAHPRPRRMPLATPPATPVMEVAMRAIYNERDLASCSEHLLQLAQAEGVLSQDLRPIAQHELQHLLAEQAEANEDSPAHFDSMRPHAHAEVDEIESAKMRAERPLRGLLSAADLAVIGTCRSRQMSLTILELGLQEIRRAVRQSIRAKKQGERLRRRWREELLRSHRGRIVLNVGGELFQTSLHTLTKKAGRRGKHKPRDGEPHVHMLCAMFQGPWRELAQAQDHDEYFIDRDPTHFRFVLNYLRDGYVALPDDVATCLELLAEANFYQVKGLAVDIQKHIDQLNASWHV